MLVVAAFPATLTPVVATWPVIFTGAIRAQPVRMAGKMKMTHAFDIKKAPQCAALLD